jgi:hypothetical protein
MKSKIGSSAPTMAPEKALHPLREREQREKDISMREGRVRKRKRVRKREEG